MLRKGRNDMCMLAMEWQPKGKRKKWDDLKPHGEERCKKKPSQRGGLAGRKSGAQRKTGLVGERKLQSYAAHGVERSNQLTN